MTDGANLEVAMEFEVPHNDEGPPVLGPSTVFETEPESYRESDEDYSVNDFAHPPDLERHPYVNPLCNDKTLIFFTD